MRLAIASRMLMSAKRSWRARAARARSSVAGARLASDGTKAGHLRDAHVDAVLFLCIHTCASTQGSLSLNLVTVTLAQGLLPM